MSQRLHVPQVILVHVHTALRRNQVERRQAEIVERTYRPAVASVCFYVFERQVQALAIISQQARHFGVTFDRGAQYIDGLRQRSAGRRTRRRILLLEQLLRLCGPRHEFAV